MIFKTDPDDNRSWFEGMQAHWCEAELEALYGLSLLESRTSPFSTKIRQRTENRIALNLSQTQSRAAQLRMFLENGYGPPDIILDTLPRIARTEATLRKMLTVARTIMVVPDEANPGGRFRHHAICRIG